VVRQSTPLWAGAHRCAAKTEASCGSGLPLVTTGADARTPGRVFHLKTACSFLERRPLCHPTTAAAMLRTSPAAAIGGVGFPFTGGVEVTRSIDIQTSGSKGLVGIVNAHAADSGGAPSCILKSSEGGRTVVKSWL
jgi:hypothetical protein